MQDHSGVKKMKQKTHPKRKFKEVDLMLKKTPLNKICIN